MLKCLIRRLLHLLLSGEPQPSMSVLQVNELHNFEAIMIF
jgi:hypothetical protein